jgi:hypothetical protein
VAAELESLKQLARVFKQSAFTTSSQKTYRSQMKCFLQFCLDYKCVPVPCSQETLVCYTAFLSKKMLPGSIANYLNAVRIIHVESGHPNPLSDNYELSMLKRGIARIKGVPPKQKQPITLEILLKVRSSVNLVILSDLSNIKPLGLERLFHAMKSYYANVRLFDSGVWLQPLVTWMRARVNESLMAATL